MACLPIIFQDESQTVGNSPLMLLQPDVKPTQPNPTHLVALWRVATFNFALKHIPSFVKRSKDTNQTENFRIFLVPLQTSQSIQSLLSKVRWQQFNSHWNTESQAALAAVRSCKGFSTGLQRDRGFDGKISSLICATIKFSIPRIGHRITKTGESSFPWR